MILLSMTIFGLKTLTSLRTGLKLRIYQLKTGKLEDEFESYRLIALLYSLTYEKMATVCLNWHLENESIFLKNKLDFLKKSAS